MTTIALVGNPNCGKSTLFNALTGSRQRVGNWTGVTVDKKTGDFSYANNAYNVVDLPGLYSLSTNQEQSQDELIASKYILSEQPDLFINIIDATNLERNLYLTSQLLEMNVPMIIAVNMIDVAKLRGLKIDLAYLSKQLNVPVVPIIASKKTGINELKRKIYALCSKEHVQNYNLEFKTEVEDLVTDLSGQIDFENNRAYSLRLLEGDVRTGNLLNTYQKDFLTKSINEFQQSYDEDIDIILADARYQYIHQLVKTCVCKKHAKANTLTAKIDAILLNRFLGLPIFLFVMYAVFFLSVNVGSAFQDFFNIASETIFVKGAAHLLTAWGAPFWLNSIIADGIGRGINTIVTFIPVIGSMFFVLTFLEDSGYMARAAFVMDRLMQLLGLPGKSFVPLIVGFGCNVPAIMGARTLENNKDRILTILMSPFMSCGARLSVFALFASAFFPQGGGAIIFLLYIIGITMAIFTGLLLKSTVLKGGLSPFIMELPPYHLPSVTSLFYHSWHKLKGFLLKAGKIIMPIVVVLGVLSSITFSGKIVEAYDDDSILADVGKTIVPVFSPMGITENNWQAAVGIFSGILAKEVVVGTLNTLYSQASSDSEAQDEFSLLAGLKQALNTIPEKLHELGTAILNPIYTGHEPEEFDNKTFGSMQQKFAGSAAAFAYLLFVLLYMPCVSATATIGRELNKKWMWFSIAWTTILAYTTAVMFFQLSTLLLHPTSSFLWVISCLFALGSVYYFMRQASQHEAKLEYS